MNWKLHKVRTRWKVVGVIGLLLLALLGVLAWGYLQPKPTGYALSSPEDELAEVDGWSIFTIDAGDRNDWAFFDFELGHDVETTLPADDWDLAFKRTDLLLNSTLSGPDVSEWYNYSFMTHTVHAKDDSYLLRTGSTKDVLVKFDSYYCENEDPGCVTFRYRMVAALADDEPEIRDTDGSG